MHIPGHRGPLVIDTFAVALTAFQGQGDSKLCTPCDSAPKVVPLADGSNICGHVQYSIPNQNFDKQFVARVDYTIGSNDHLYGRYMFDSYQLAYWTSDAG